MYTNIHTTQKVIPKYKMAKYADLHGDIITGIFISWIYEILEQMLRGGGGDLLFELYLRYNLYINLTRDHSIYIQQALTYTHSP